MFGRSAVPLFIALFVVSSSAFAGSAPSIGGAATITATIGEAGVINVGGGAGGATVNAKQAVASVLSGTVQGALTLAVDVGQAGVINVGGGVGGATVNACQSVGTIGSDCN
jgi:hypothetical protein